MPYILFFIIAFAGAFGQFLPISIQSSLYAVSLSIKSLIIFVLPFIVFGLLFKTATSLAGSGTKMIAAIIAAVCCSNFLSTMVSYSVGSFVYQYDLSIVFPESGEALTPIWTLSLPRWIGNDMALFLGLASGLFCSWYNSSFAKTLSSFFEKIVSILLRLLLFVIPLFVAGFVIKMNHDQIIYYIIYNYSFIFLLIAAALFSYVALIYCVANTFDVKAAIKSIKNMVPAALVGFGSMSSAAAMPLTILGTKKNSKNPDLASATIPATVNIHLIGDCFAIPIFAFAVLKSFAVVEPSFLSYLLFSFYFVLAKFSVAAVPGGGILVMLPILESYLGFNAEMLSLITALYILFDPVITCGNILGNGGFALVLERLVGLPAKKDPSKLRA